MDTDDSFCHALQNARSNIQELPKCTPKIRWAYKEVDKEIDKEAKGGQMLNNCAPILKAQLTKRSRLGIPMRVEKEPKAVAEPTHISSQRLRNPAG